MPSHTSSRTAAVVVASSAQADARIGLSERGYVFMWFRVAVSLTCLTRTVLQADLLASIQQYIRLRESLAPRNAPDPLYAEGPQSNVMGVSHVNADQGGSIPLTAVQADSVDHNKVPMSDNLRAANTDGSLPTACQPKPGETTCTHLQHIAQTSEEAIRAAEEKVSIAQTAYETVRG